MYIWCECCVMRLQPYMPNMSYVVHALYVICIYGESAAGHMRAIMSYVCICLICHMSYMLYICHMYSGTRA